MARPGAAGLRPAVPGPGGKGRAVRRGYAIAHVAARGTARAKAPVSATHPDSATWRQGGGCARLVPMVDMETLVSLCKRRGFVYQTSWATVAERDPAQALARG